MVKNRNAIRNILTTVFCLLTTFFVFAQGPQWWFSRGVVDTNLPAKDYAPITQGQLKWLALNAYYEMEAYFGAGSNVTAVVGAFPIATNYLPNAAHGYPATIGQLKYVAQLFYDRLYELNLTNTFPANMPGYYAWGHASATNDFALANIGQAKYVFSFDSAVDSDGDGLSDWREVVPGTNGLRLTRYVFSGGSGRLSSTNIILLCSVAQSGPIGILYGSNIILRAGFHSITKPLEARVSIKPEVLKVTPGVLTAFVRLPEDYPASGIINATCEGASAESMELSDDGMEMAIKFRRQAIEAVLAQRGETLDTHFVVEGTWQGADGERTFVGEDDIARIVN